MMSTKKIKNVKDVLNFQSELVALIKIPNQKNELLNQS